MKRANVVAIRDLGPTRSAGSSPNDPDLADILSRYPTISDAEQRQLLHFVKTAKPPQIRETFLSRGLEGRLLAFRKAHTDELRRGWSTWTPFLMALLLIATLLQMLA